MDNKIFNVNGKGDALLLKTLDLCFELEGKNTKCEGWTEDVNKGLILLWYITESERPHCTRLPAPMTASEVLPMVNAWLSGVFASTVKSDSHWDGAVDHDGSDSAGWRVYREDWGHVGRFHQGLCAIRPIVCWHGK